MENKLGFEIETCSRCGGSGHFSYNQIDGSRCFKCGGAKVTYTKRGQAAALEKALAYQASLTKAGKPKAAGRKESANV